MKKNYLVTSEMIRFFKNPYDALDNIYKELFVQEYSKPPDTTGGIIFKYADRELYDTALFVFNVKMRPVYEVKGIKVRF